MNRIWVTLVKVYEVERLETPKDLGKDLGHLSEGV